MALIEIEGMEFYAFHGHFDVEKVAGNRFLVNLKLEADCSKAGETDNLEVTYNPTNTTDDKTITWTSSDITIATIDNGVVTAIAPGTATITATVGDKTAKYIIDVKL